MKVSCETLRLLKDLQSLDLEIMCRQKEKNTLPPRMVSVSRRKEALSRDIEEISAEMKSLSRGRRKSEALLDDRLEELDRLRSQKNLVSSNEAYSALLKEIEAMEAERNRAEEEILLYMERLEELSGTLEDKKTELAAAEEEFRALDRENNLRTEKLDGLLARLLEQRREKAASIDDEIMPAYEKVRRARGGVALARAGGNVCSGCSLELRPQVMNELMKGEILACERRSRLLYRDGEES